MDNPDKNAFITLVPMFMSCLRENMIIKVTHNGKETICCVKENKGDKIKVVGTNIDTEITAQDIYGDENGKIEIIT